MEDKIRLLMETAGCNRYEADLAYKSAGGDFVEALDFLNRVSPRLGITRGKFMAGEKFIYGAFLVITDIKKKSVLTASAVATKNPSIYEMDVSQSWEDIEKTVYSARLGAGALPELSGIFQEKMLAAFVADPDLRLAESSLRETLSTVFDVSAPAVVLEYGEEPYKTPAVPELNIPLRQTVGRPGSVTLEVLPLFDDKSPIKACDVSPGEVIWIKITDEREIALYLADRLGAMKEGKILPLASEVASVSSDNGEVTMEFRFAENVAAYSRIPASSRIKAADKTDGISRISEWWRKIFGGTK